MEIEMIEQFHNRWMILVLAFLITFTEHLLLFSYSPLVLQITAEMNLTHAQAGFIFSVCMLMLIILRVPWGFLCDRIGVKMAIGMASTFMGVFGLLRGFATNYGTLLMFQMLFGVGVAGIMPCLPKLASTWFPRAKLGLVTGVYTAGFSIGSMLGLGLTPYIFMITDAWRTVSHVYGVWGVMLAAIWWITASEPRARSQGDSCKVRTQTSLLNDFIAVIKVRDVWVLAGILLCSMGSYDTISVWLPSILEVKMISQATTGFIASMLPLGFLTASLLVGMLSDYVGLRRPFILFLGLISGLSLLAVERTLGPPLLVATFMTGFCTTGVLTLVLMISAELPEVARCVASATGIISSLGNISSFVMPTVVGYIKDITGSFFPAMIVITVITEMTLILGLMIKETGTRHSIHALDSSIG